VLIRDEERRGMPPNLREERIAPDTDDNRRQNRANIYPRGHSCEPMDQQASCPMACLPQQACVGNKGERFSQPSSPETTLGGLD
jgi:hypothetical protein